MPITQYVEENGYGIVECPIRANYFPKYRYKIMWSINKTNECLQKIIRLSPPINDTILQM